MDEKALLAANEADYMNAEQLIFFDNRLQQLRTETLDEITAIKTQMLGNSQVSDVLDRAQQEEESQIALRIADRKRQLIPKIDAARQRIRSGEYGYCLQTGEPIGIERLLIRPTAEYCTDVKTINEQKEGLYEHKTR
ncbi:MULTISPECIES: TraR/DksA C4-type zinc finger protein [unclassified Methylophaga]|uniref:TraR/DksA family transcriptional regulator n=1 Tax=unclassified Methylophaga TaxID=2629249 RepID=UPI000C96C7BD|nr:MULTISPECIES: TraR/DksA C4-type zinc finger protein [unclassified Methylophaga]MAK65680.1 molecular chaperone DnaK [Methylophaga sp.]MAY16404.1 molecular chaperone DnaK [Methylophaga sp.]HAO25952.1 molecular chaperone DnaK [Methylophaga sp.]HCD05346.1 molecular chaperone DnaK [Methylophaga sp.]|tara:strand:- start:16337 stop:16747 length:411 start_codon:yes stop_codon:yes gene_type:complete